LLWRHRKSTPTQSAVYWSEIVCEKSKLDNSVIDTLSRSFSVQTKGIFAVAKPPKKPRKKKAIDVDSLLDLRLRDRERIQMSIQKMDEKLRKMRGIVAIAQSNHRIYVVPVPYVPAWELNLVCKEYGTAHWVTSEELFSIARSTSGLAMVTPLPATEQKWNDMQEEKKTY